MELVEYCRVKIESLIATQRSVRQRSARRGLLHDTRENSVSKECAEKFVARDTYCEGPIMTPHDVLGEL